EFTLHGLAGMSSSLDQVLANQMEYTYFPVNLGAMHADIGFHEVREGQFNIDDAKITVHYLNHTCVCLGYRIEADGKSVVYATDTEPHSLVLTGLVQPNDAAHGELPKFVHEQDKSLAEFVRNTDLLIMDAQYRDEESAQRVG